LYKLLYTYILRPYFLLVIGLSGTLQKAFSQDYFQQEVNHKINVALDDIRHELNGFESVEYINNSPDTLGFLYFHLWPNAYSGNETELAKEIIRREGKQKLFNDPDLRGYIDSLDFFADGYPVEWNLLTGYPDICILNLKNPLNPGDTINITTPFHIKIPKGVTSRLGHIGESYQISQWYPKPAVYDKSGWHQMPYLDQGEFFSEFGSYDVSITLPANYVVGSTGNLQNEEEKRWLDLLSEDPFRMSLNGKKESDFPPSSAQVKTIRYTENKIHDFAWFADKKFNVLKGKINLPESGKEITTWVMFTDREASLWINAITYVNQALWNLSEWIGDYPYNSFTAVQSALNSGAGMEYPGLTVIGLAGDPYLLDEVIAHEICHSWFYSAIGSDERRYPYMDESLASAFENRYIEKRYPGKKLWELGFENQKVANFLNIAEMPVQRIQELEWIIPSRRNLDQPATLASSDYTYENYGSVIYSKAGQGFNYLRTFLGDSVFDSVMHDYYAKWKYKHPQPEDLRAVFESNTGKDLSWFFNDFLTTTKRLDYKIVRIRNNKVLIKNAGELKAPLLLAGLKGDSVCYEKWEDGFEGKKWFYIMQYNFSEIKIDPGHNMTELYRLNNNIHTSGIFRKRDPLIPQLLYTVEDPGKRTLLYLPTFHWNKTDGLMIGAALHNGTLVPKPVEYFIIPLYSFQNPGISGYGKIALNITPYDNIIRLGKLSLEGSQFGSPGNQKFHKVKIGLDLFFTPHIITNQINQKVFVNYCASSDLMQILALNEAKMLSYLQFGYRIEKNRIINPFDLTVLSESGRLYQKASVEFNYRYSYRGKNSGLDVRLFAGTMLKNESDYSYNSFSASGRSGREQYLLYGVYPDRYSEFPTTFWSRQMNISEGGLVSFLNDTLGYSRSICSLTLTSNLPGKASIIPLKSFVNIILNDHGSGNTNNSHLFCEAGIKAGIWGFFEVYFPLIVSRNIGELTGTYKDRIRFVFSLDKLNPSRIK